MRSRVVVRWLFLVCALPGVARAKEVPCAPVERGVIQLDGLLGDWQDVPPVKVDDASQVRSGRAAWSGPSDLSFAVFCNHDAKALFLALAVKDELFVRTQAAKLDDHVVVRLGGRRLVVFPGDLRKIRARVHWQGSKKPAKGVAMVEAMQPMGYSLELKIPLAQVPGYRPGIPSVPGGVSVVDSDSRVKKDLTSVHTTEPGRFVFAQQKSDLAGFLKDKGYRESQIRQRFTVDVAGDRRLEQVILVGNTVGILGDGLPGGAYLYLDLAVQSPKDISSVKLLDLNGDGKAEVVTRHTETGASGKRELLSVFRFDVTGKFVRPLTHEVSKVQGERWLTNRVTFKARARRGKTPGGIDVVIDQPKAKGFTAETFKETPATDCQSVLLPWGDEKKRVFRFEGDEYQQL